MLDTKGIVDPHGEENRYKKWNKTNMDGVFPSDKVIIEKYISDMEQGKNIYRAKKGCRSYSRLNTLKNRIPFMARWCKKHFNKPLTKMNDEDVTSLFFMIKSGKIRKLNGEIYASYGEYVKDFKAFWHWYMKINKKLYKKEKKAKYLIEDITEDVADPEPREPKFIYLTLEQFKKLCSNAKPFYRLLMTTLWDAGIRAPKELMNVRVKDLEDIPNSDKGFLNIRTETSKTFGRKIKLMLSYPMIKEYIKENKLKSTDYIFQISPPVANRYLKRLAFRVLGIGEEGKEKDQKRTRKIYKQGLTMYDFRHCSACYWLPKYPTQAALMYRFGWKNSRMIEYYTQFLGMADNISEENLLDDVGKTELQKNFEVERNKRELLEEQFSSQNAVLKQMQKQMNALGDIKKLKKLMKKN